EDWEKKPRTGPPALKVERTVFDVNGADSVGNTTLSDEVSKRQADIVDELIRAGADVNAPNVAGITPLMTAVAFDAQSTALLERLLGAGADVNAQDKGGMTALRHAAHYGRKPAVPVLLAAGADARTRDNQGRTAAAITGNSDSELNRLLEAAARR